MASDNTALSDNGGSIDFSGHPSILNKPPIWSSAYAVDWQAFESASLEDLRSHVGGGRAFVPALMSSGRRSSEAFVHSDLAVVDIDHGLTVAAFCQHPLAANAAWIYTTASHKPEAERFRIVFRLPQRINDPELYKALVTLLTRTLGGDRSCTDPCRLFYGHDTAEHPLWQPEARLPLSLLEDARQEAQRTRQRFLQGAADYDERTIQQAIFCLDQVLSPTSDGQRAHFVKVTAAASSAGEAIYPAWSDWASRGHHGSGKNSRQASERFFRGFHGRSTLATIFYLADEESPGWRNTLPDELRSDGSWGPKVSAAGYDHEDFLGLDDEENERPYREDTRTPSLFDADCPWSLILPPHPPTATAPQAAAAPPAPPAALEPPAQHDPIDDDDDDDIDYDDDLFGEIQLEDGPMPEPPAPLLRRRRQNDPDVNTIQQVKDLLLELYPGLRLNAMSLNLECGPKDKPRLVDDISTSYVRIGRRAGVVFQKTLVHDTALIIGFENQYNPVLAYLEDVSSQVDPCPYFKHLAAELLGLSDNPMSNPRLADGRLLANVILERFLVGAVARVVEPGCVHDWMPILIGGQSVGKSNFFRFLTPPDVAGQRDYPWVATIQQGIGNIKEKPHILHAGWLVLLDEVERYFKRQYVEEFKNLVSVSVDRSARKYENERSFPRAFVLCGAANSGDFFCDPTGNRRFMPIQVKGVIPNPRKPKLLMVDLDRLQRDRDAIWSAAYKAYRDGAPHTFSSDEIDEISDYLNGFQEDSPLEAQLLKVLELRRSGVFRNRNYVTLADVFSWLEVPIDRQDAMKRQITDLMKRHGWNLSRVSIANRANRIWMQEH